MIINLIGLLYTIMLVSKLVFRQISEEIYGRPKTNDDDDIEEILII